MGNFTQRELRDIEKLKSKTLAKYLRFCIHFNEVPREDQLLLIEGCTSLKAFEAAIEIYDRKISEHLKQ